MRDFDFLVERATEPKRTWTNKEKLIFHCFNPDGVYYRKRELDKKISQLVDEGKANSGALLVHGTLRDTYTEKLVEMNRGKRYIKRIDLEVLVELIEKDIVKAQKFIDEKS